MSKPYEVVDDIVIGVFKDANGWYYWTCDAGVIDELDGEIPEGDSIGPFKTEKQARTAAGLPPLN